ncbi:MAG: flippase-like domain-containing protein [Clostridia bacterium]|nr:flippase-like domain-containing protein [Clostridia bacterium]
MTSNNGYTPTGTPEGERKFNIKGKIIWTVVFLLITAATIWAVTAQSKNFSLSEFFGFVGSASPVWMIAALLAMLCFIIFEAAAIASICRSFGYKTGFFNGLSYSASDIYFSAITPSASGGQPACGYFMVKDGIPFSVMTVALVSNLAMYTLSIIFIGIVCLILRPMLIYCFNTVSIVLIFVGLAAQVALFSGFMLLLTKEKWLKKIMDGFIGFLAKIRLIRNPDKHYQRIDKLITEYKLCSKHIRGHMRMFLKVFVFNVLQRTAQIAATVFTFLAIGGKPSDAFDIFALQSYVVLGTNCMPVPGAIGITDYFMLDAFESIMDGALAVNFELLSRSLSFYVCILICGITSLIKYIMQSRRRNKL